MKIYILSLTFLILTSLLSCERKCGSYTDKLLTGKIEEHFGVYRPDNWWVYNNKNGTKKDSQYIVDYKEIRINDRTRCERDQQRTFVIVNTQLPGGPPLYSLGDSLYLIYKAAGSGIMVNLNTPVGASQWVSFPQFSYSSYTDSITSPGSVGKNVLDSISLNGTKYYSILIGNDGTSTFYLAKGKGLVGWGNILDTFNLVNFKIF